MILEIILAATLAPEQIDPARQAVLCAEVTFSRSVEDRDFSAFMSFLDPEVRFVTGSIHKGPEEVGQAWAALFQPGGPELRWRPAIVEVVANGTLAISRGPYRMTQIAEDGEVNYFWGTFNSTWRLNRDGNWQVLFDAGGDHGMTPSEDDIVVLNGEPDCPKVGQDLT